MVFSRATKRQVRSGINEIYLVPECLSITGIPDEMRSNYTQMKKLADYTKMKVDRRVQALRKFNSTLLNNETVSSTCMVDLHCFLALLNSMLT